MSVLTEYNEQKTMAAFKRESYEEGIENGQLRMIYKFELNGKLTHEEAVKEAGMPEEEYSAKTVAFKQ